MFWKCVLKKCLLLFGSNSLKVSVLFDMNSEESVYYCLVVTLWKCRYCLIWTLKTVYYYLVKIHSKCQLFHFIDAFGGERGEGRYHLDTSIMYLTDDDMMNCFCDMVDRQKAFSLISSQDHCQRSSPLQISNMPWAGFESAQNLSSGLVEWSCAVVITTTP